MIRKVIIIFLFALSARALYLFVLPPSTDDLSFADSSMYLSLADDMIESRGFNRHNADNGFSPETERTPLYPAFLALLKLSVDNYPFSVVIWQAVIDSMTCVVIGLIAAEFLPGLLMFGGVLAAFNLTLIIISAHILTDTFFLFFFSLFILASLQYFKKVQLVKIALASSLLGICVLIRSVVLYFLPIYLFFCIISIWTKTKSLKKISLHITCSLFVLIILLGPLVYRNYKHYDHVSMVSQGGTHALFWVVPLTLHLSRGISYDEAEESMRIKLQEHMTFNGIIKLPDNPFENSELLMGVAYEALFEMGLPDISKAWFLGSIINMLSPSPIMIPYVQSLKKNSFYYTEGVSQFDKVITFFKNENNFIFMAIIIPSIVVTFIYFIMQISGFFLMIKYFKNTNMFIVLYSLAIVCYYLIITGPIIGVKYRLPIEPILILFMSYSCYIIFNKFISRKINNH